MTDRCTKCKATIYKCKTRSAWSLFPNPNTLSARPFFYKPQCCRCKKRICATWKQNLETCGNTRFWVCSIMYCDVWSCIDSCPYDIAYCTETVAFHSKQKTFYSCQPQPSPIIMPRQLYCCNLPRTPTFGLSPICWERNWCSPFGRQLKIYAMMMPPRKADQVMVGGCGPKDSPLNSSTTLGTRGRVVNKDKSRIEIGWTWISKTQGSL